MNKKSKKKIIIVAAAVILIAVVGCIAIFAGGGTPPAPTEAEAKELLYNAAAGLPGVGAKETAALFDGEVEIKVSSVVDGDNGTLDVQAEISSPGLGAVIAQKEAELAELRDSGAKSDEMKSELAGLLSLWFKEAELQKIDVTVTLAAAGDKWTVHTDLAFADACWGGLASLSDGLKDSSDPLEKRIRSLCEIKFDEGELPDTRSGIARWWDDIKAQFKLSFIDEGRWQMILRGLGTTLAITLFAALMGVVLGFLVAVVRVTHDRTGKLGVLNGICKVYLTVIRGTPVLIQLMIIYFVILAPVRAPKLLVAILAFGINSGAYVAEIVRGGIMSIDIGQMEAGRSLGLNYRRTMVYIILPQALKAVLPALGNEFITLVKETSVSAYIALEDLTRAGDKIRGATYTAFMPLVAVALIYLAVVMLLTALLGRLERRLRKGDRGQGSL